MEELLWRIRRCETSEGRDGSRSSAGRILASAETPNAEDEEESGEDVTHEAFAAAGDAIADEESATDFDSVSEEAPAATEEQAVLRKIDQQHDEEHPTLLTSLFKGDNVCVCPPLVRSRGVQPLVDVCVCFDGKHYNTYAKVPHLEPDDPAQEGEGHVIKAEGTATRTAHRRQKSGLWCITAWQSGRCRSKVERNDTTTWETHRRLTTGLCCESWRFGQPQGTGEGPKEQGEATDNITARVAHRR